MATKSLGTLTLDLVAKIGGFTGPLDKAGRKTSTFGKKAEKTFQSVKKAGLAMGAAYTGAAAAVIASSIKQENAVRQLEQRIASTGGAAGRTSEELQALAGSLQKVTTFGDESIIEMQGLLLTFTNIQGEIFDRANPAILDMATAMGTDLKSAALQVGKALNDPIAGLSSLGRAGVQFTDDQKDLIKSLVDTGRGAEAQALILAELEKQFGGAASAAADTFGGSLKQVSNAFGDLLEAPGGLNDAKEGMQDLTAILQDPETVKAAGALTTGIINGFTSAVGAVRELIGATQFLAEEFAAITVGIAADDIARLEADAGEIRRLLSSDSLLDQGNRIRFFGPDGVVEYLNDEELKQKLSEIDGAIESYYSVGKRPKIPVEFDTVGSSGTPVAPLDFESPTGGGDDSKKAQSYLESLKKQVDLLGQSKDAKELDKLASMGASEEQVKLASALLDSVAAFEAQTEAQEEARNRMAEINSQAESIRESLLSEEAAIQESYERRRDIILENTKFTGEAQNNLLRELDAQRLEDLKAIEDEKSDTIMAGYSALLDVVGSYYDGMQGKQAAYARVAISIGQMLLDEEKREAVQKIIARTHSAAMGAYESLSSIPVVGPALGVAAAGAIYVAGAASGAKVLGLAHDGIDAIPETGTWILEKGERVTTASTSAKLDRTLDDIQEGRGAKMPGSGIEVVNNVKIIGGNKDSTVTSSGRQVSDNKFVVDIVIDQMTRPNSQGRRGMAGNSNLVNRGSM